MISLPVAYLCASAVAVKVAAFSYERDRRDAVPIAAALFGGCLIYNASWFTRAWWLWPPLEAATVWAVALTWPGRARRWKAVVIAAEVAQVLAHARWQIGDKFGGSSYAYHLTLNLLFLVELLAVSSSGSRRVGNRVRLALAGRLNPGHRWSLHLLLWGPRGAPRRPNGERR